MNIQRVSVEHNTNNSVSLVSTRQQTSIGTVVLSGEKSANAEQYHDQQAVAGDQAEGLAALTPQKFRARADRVLATVIVLVLSLSLIHI